MTELYINGQKIEGVKEVAISLAVTDGLNAVKGIYSKTITVPATSTNRQIFNFVEFGTEGGLNKNVEAKAQLIVDGLEIIRGYAFVEGVTVENDNFYNINVFSGNKSWVKELNGIKLTDLDLSESDFVFTGLRTSGTIPNITVSLVKYNDFSHWFIFSYAYFYYLATKRA